MIFENLDKAIQKTIDKKAKKQNQEYVPTMNNSNFTGIDISGTISHRSKRVDHKIENTK